MSWSHGSELMEKIIQSAQKFILEDDDRTLFYEEMVVTFYEEFDCDTLDECSEIDPAFDEALKNSGYYDEDEEEDWSEVDDGWGYEDEENRY